MDTKRCDCGCSEFRFKELFDGDTDKLYTNICSNCSHTLAEHLKLPSVEN